MGRKKAANRRSRGKASPSRKLEKLWKEFESTGSLEAYLRYDKAMQELDRPQKLRGRKPSGGRRHGG